MAEIWETSDRKQFDTRWDAERHQSGIDTQQAKREAESAQLRREAEIELDGYRTEIKSRTERGEELCRLNKYDDAIFELDKAISLSNRYKGLTPLGTSYAWRGMSYYGKGNIEQAFSDLNMAIYSISPGNLNKYDSTSPKITGHVDVNDVLSFSPETLKSFNESPNRMITIRRNCISLTYSCLGLVLEKKGIRNKAIICLKIAADWDSYNYALLIAEGLQQEFDMSYALRGLKNLGIEYTTKIPQLDPWEKQTLIKFTFVPASTADITLPINSNEYINIAMKSIRDDPDKTISYSNKVIELKDHNIAEAYYTRAMAYMTKKQWDNAIADFKVSADYGYENSIGMLKKMEIDYKPQSPSSSAAGASTPPAAKKFCGKCGNKLNESAKFCGGCGGKVGG